jgi:hypothetical protein
VDRKDWFIGAFHVSPVFFGDGDGSLPLSAAAASKCMPALILGFGIKIDAPQMILILWM